MTLTVEDQHPYTTTTARHAGYSQLIHTAKNQYQKLETNISRKGLRGHSPNFHIYVSVGKLYIPKMDLPILQQEICGPILGIYKSFTNT